MKIACINYNGGECFTEYTNSNIDEIWEFIDTHIFKDNSIEFFILWDNLPKGIESCIMKNGQLVINTKELQRYYRKVKVTRFVQLDLFG